jgi:phospho-N-acetylmuramoyl-pentapeptide-transferase
MENLCIRPVLISFCITVAAGPVLIPFLKKWKLGQTVRKDGPKTHLKKNGTPTMGGILILIAVVVTALLCGKDCPRMFPVLFLTVGFGMIGFLDDYLKILFSRSLGLKAWQKLLLQLVVTGIYVWYLVYFMGAELYMKLPFLSDRVLDLGRLRIPVLIFIVLATANGTNFTDGLDGLAAGVTVIAATFFSVAAVWYDYQLLPITCAVTGALLGFLLFNVHPASVFMGDTGSLALGGFIAAAACAMELPLFIPIVGFIYFIEVLSVILQVLGYKITGGKRILKMAPFHHHLELVGWSETKIVAVFSILTAVLCMLAVMAL